MRVVVAGGGNVGTFIASDLATRAATRSSLLEQNRQVVQRAVAVGEHPGVEFRVGRRLRAGAAHRGRPGTADVVAAVTGDDEDNLVISLLAKQEFGVPRVVARVNHPKNEWLFNEMWGVDVSVSTPHLLTALVEEAVTVGTPGAPPAVRGRQGAARRGHAGRGVAGRRVRVVDLGMPRDSTLVAIIRDEHVVVPRGDTPLEIGDEVLALVTPESEVRSPDQARSRRLAPTRGSSV